MLRWGAPVWSSISCLQGMYTIFYAVSNEPILASWLGRQSLEMTSTYVLKARLRKTTKPYHSGDYHSCSWSSRHRPLRLDQLWPREWNGPWATHRPLEPPRLATLLRSAPVSPPLPPVHRSCAIGSSARRALGHFRIAVRWTRRYWFKTARKTLRGFYGIHSAPE